MKLADMVAQYRAQNPCQQQSQQQPTPVTPTAQPQGLAGLAGGSWGMIYPMAFNIAGQMAGRPADAVGSPLYERLTRNFF